jgi:hypothetical protein
MSYFRKLSTHSLQGSWRVGEWKLFVMREKWLPEIGGNLLATRGERVGKKEKEREGIMRGEGIIRHSGPSSGSQQ